MNKLAAIRLQKGYSLAELAKRSGVSRAHLYRIEVGESDPTLHTMCNIAKALRVSVWDVFGCDE